MAMKFSLYIFHFKFYFVIFSPLCFMLCLCCFLFRNHSFGGCMCECVFTLCIRARFFRMCVCWVGLYHTIFFRIVVVHFFFCKFLVSFFGDLFLGCFLSQDCRQTYELHTLCIDIMCFNCSCVRDRNDFQSESMDSNCDLKHVLHDLSVRNQKFNFKWIS